MDSKGPGDFKTILPCQLTAPGQQHVPEHSCGRHAVLQAIGLLQEIECQNQKVHCQMQVQVSENGEKDLLGLSWAPPSRLRLLFVGSKAVQAESRFEKQNQKVFYQAQAQKSPQEKANSTRSDSFAKEKAGQLQLRQVTVPRRRENHQGHADQPLFERHTRAGRTVLGYWR